MVDVENSENNYMEISLIFFTIHLEGETVVIEVNRRSRSFLQLYLPENGCSHIERLIRIYKLRKVNILK